MTPDATARPHILLIGVGDLTTRLLHLLVSRGFPGHITVASRSADRAIRYANLASYVGLNLGSNVSVEGVALDLTTAESCASALEALQPGLIFMGASLQAARGILELSPDVFALLDQAQLGPWLPMHLVLNHRLMQAVSWSCPEAIVVNGAYPDAVGPALASVDLAPHIGIGNIGNIAPMIHRSVADGFGIPTTRVDLQLVAHHYFSHHVHRYGEADGIPHSLTCAIDGVDQALNLTDVYGRLAGPLRREGGTQGQQLTASSAWSVIDALMSETGHFLHAPAPRGLPGGYPVFVSSRKVELALPASEVEEAIAVNVAGQAIDGIESIKAGRIRFSTPNMEIMREALGFYCEEMSLDEAPEVAAEIGERYDRLLYRLAA